MTFEEQTRCVLECTRLCEDFAYTIDRRQYEKFLQLFTPDPVLDRAGRIFSGVEGLRLFCAGRDVNRYVRHICSNIRIDPTGSATATGTSCATMYHAAALPDAELPLPTAIPLVAEYEDDYTLTEAGWKIKSRKVTIVFQA